MSKTYGPVYKSPVAGSVPFDNATNGFVADDTQAAIEEAKQNAEGFPRAGLALTANGTVGDLAWITYTELLANPRILFPVKTRLKEFTWVNSNINLRTMDFKFYRNGQAGGNLIYTHTVSAGDRTAGYGYLAFPTNLDFNPGESLYVQVDYTAAGTSLSDLALVIWISRLA
jgi:hypothetical protein